MCLIGQKVEFGSGNAEVGKRGEDGGQMIEFGSGPPASPERLAMAGRESFKGVGFKD